MSSAQDCAEDIARKSCRARLLGIASARDCSEGMDAIRAAFADFEFYSSVGARLMR